jgi:hemerythrin
MPLQWDESLALGIPEIDEQHREIFARFRAFTEACHAEVDLPELLGLLEFLQEYAATHFASEEQLLRQDCHPQLELQKQEHRLFIDDLDQLRAKLLECGASSEITLTLKRTMIQWLINHISHVDFEYKEYLQPAS